jgi:hypothetical protein
MASDTLDAEFRTALQVQHDLLRRIRDSVDDVEERFEDTDDTSEKLRELKELMDEIEADSDKLRPGDLADYDPGEIDRIYERHQASVRQDIESLDFENWDRFVQQTKTYALKHGIDPLAPYESLLTEGDLQRLRDESYDAQYRWDRADYLFVLLAGITASLVDYFLVMIPQDMPDTHLGVESKYAGQQGSPLTEWMQSYDTHSAEGPVADFTNWLGDMSKVPYDRTTAVIDGELIENIPGMSPDTHRLQTMGHDSAIGWIVGFFDVLRGTMTGFSYDNSSGVHELFQGKVQSYLPSSGYEETAVRLIKALLKPLAHLVSDVGSDAGLPAPFMTLMQGINAGSIGEHDKTVGQIARQMYRNGYDFRHFLTSGITPAVVEIVLRGYLMLRHYSENGETKFRLASNPKYRLMLLAAHGIASAGNAGKIALYRGNPLAINQAEWMALFRYLLPHLKYVFFDRHRLRMEHMNGIIEEEWEQILGNSRDILQHVSEEEMKAMQLGRTE